MEQQHRIIIAEDHTILREGLRALLSSKPNLEVVGEAEDGLEAIRTTVQLLPDLVIMDLSLPKMNGMEAAKEIKRSHPQIKVLALTVHKAEEYIFAGLQAGIDGYILKDATSGELLTAIKSVLAGKRYICPGVSEKVIEGYIEGRKTVKTRSSWDTLTQREREILKLIAEGYKNKEIAEHLCISVKTIEKHRSNLMRKLDLHSASALTGYAMEKGLVTR
ncbi:MAG: response regulator [Syntrophobacteria bacterium]